MDVESFWMKGYADQIPNSGHELVIYDYSKGQLISKWFSGVINFLQKTNEWIRLYY